jgi:glycosyltransferase involved in cell wall biosynthesis
MKVSVCMSTHVRPDALRRTLDSILCQMPYEDYEVIVVDDGSKDAAASKVCSEFPRVRCIRIERSPDFRNPSVGRNVAYRAARGEVIIAQSDEVIHSPFAIRQLTEELKPGTFVIARVLNFVPEGAQSYTPSLPVFTGPENRRPLFFLGALYREDLYAVGGNDEEFTTPAYDDDWFAACLIRGRGLKPVYSTVEGYHQDHPRPYDTIEYVRQSRDLYHKKMRMATAGQVPWQSAEGAWKYDP